MFMMQRNVESCSAAAVPVHGACSQHSCMLALHDCTVFSTRQQGSPWLHTGRTSEKISRPVRTPFRRRSACACSCALRATCAFRSFHAEKDCAAAQFK